MAEAPKAVPARKGPPPVPESALITKAAPVAQAEVKEPNKFLEALAKILSTTFWFALGLGLIAFAIIFKRLGSHAPHFLQSAVAQLAPHSLYFIAGLGLIFLGQSRSLVRKNYSEEFKKNKKWPHAWKIPLIAAQVFILQVSGLYALIVGFGKFQPITGVAGLTTLMIFFLAYFLWYVVSHFMHFFPSFASLRVAFLSSLLSAVALITWWGQSVLVSLIFAFFGVATAIASAAIATSDDTTVQRAPLVKNLCLALSIIIAFIVGWNSLSFGKPTAELVGKGLATGNLSGTVDALNFSPDGKKVAFAQKTGEGWFLQIANPGPDMIHLVVTQDEKGGVEKMEIEGREVIIDSLVAILKEARWKNTSVILAIEAGPGVSEETISEIKSKSYQAGVMKIDTSGLMRALKVPAGEGAFSPIFVDGGRAVLLDKVKGGERGLWKVRVSDGNMTAIRTQGVQPIGDGVLWSEKNGEFLYVVKSGERYELNALTVATGKSKVLMKSELPILTPSWTLTAQEIGYADGVHGLTYAFDVKSKTSRAILSDEEKAARVTLEDRPVSEVIPSPDHFRYLYLTKKDKVTEIWTVLLDGTKRKKIYETKGSIRHVSWISAGQTKVFEGQTAALNGQTIVFEEKKRKNFFATESGSVRLLDASLETVEDLILPQISIHSPAVSPDGVKVAFVGSQGLWYPSIGSGVWVALLR
jgi:hypothetical protein